VRNARPVLLALVLLAAASRAGAEEVELVPDEPASWRPSNILAPITGLFLGGPGYWYATRRIAVETTPPGAVLDLFYVRASFQKRYEQAEAPVTIVLPSRIQAGPRDSVTIRAMLDGYRHQEVTVRVRSRQEEVAIDLSPLPNSLVALTHAILAGRGALSFVTTEALSFRLQEWDEGLSVVLTETAGTPTAEETIAGLASEIVSSASSQQLGEDLVVRLALGEAARDATAPRSRQAYDEVRRLHSFSLDFVPPDGGAASVERARAALSRLGPGDVAGCAFEFDDALRAALDRAALTRALAPSGAFTDPYLRAALARLGELSPGGVVTLADGTRYRTDVPIELSAAAAQAGEVRGYLALLRAFVGELEPPGHRRVALRGLVAPELGLGRFGAAVDAAELREGRCRGSAG
jgi:hypothetical protein